MNRSAITLVVLLLVALGIGALVVWPKYQDWQAANLDLASVQGELNKLREVDSLVKNLEKAEPTLTQKTEQAKLIIPEQEEREIFVTQLDTLAKANNVNMVNFTFTGAATKAKAADEPDAGSSDTTTKAKTSSANKAVKATATGLTYNATFAGSFVDIQRFLAQLKTMPRYTDVQTFNLTQQDNGLTLQISASIYSKPLPKIPAHLKYTSQAWDYLTPTPEPTPTTSTGRPDPFSTY
jgi:hypothetical protein